MKHLKKFFEYYVIDPNFEAFENQVIQLAEKRFKDNKDMSFEELKDCVIECFGGMHEFKYGDDFAKKLAIIDKVCSAIVKGLDKE
jgi:hypothetical protein